jgi:hypothetical protein
MDSVLRIDAKEDGYPIRRCLIHRDYSFDYPRHARRCRPSAARRLRDRHGVAIHRSFSLGKVLCFRILGSSSLARPRIFVLAMLPPATHRTCWRYYRIHDHAERSMTLFVDYLFHRDKPTFSPTLVRAAVSRGRAWAERLRSAWLRQ